MERKATCWSGSLAGRDDGYGRSMHGIVSVSTEAVRRPCANLEHGLCGRREEGRSRRGEAGAIFGEKTDRPTCWLEHDEQVLKVAGAGPILLSANASN